MFFQKKNIILIMIIVLHILQTTSCGRYGKLQMPKQNESLTKSQKLEQMELENELENNIKADHVYYYDDDF